MARVFAFRGRRDIREVAVVLEALHTRVFQKLDRTRNGVCEIEMGFVRYLSLTETAVPSVYTVGSPQSLTPQTRDVACQCDAPSLKKSASIQTATQKLKTRSKATQVKPLGHSIGISCSADNVGTSVEPPRLTSSPIKRPRMEDRSFSDSST